MINIMSIESNYPKSMIDDRLSNIGAVGFRGSTQPTDYRLTVEQLQQLQSDRENDRSN
jgi:hypothetical protein